MGTAFTFIPIQIAALAGVSEREAGLASGSFTPPRSSAARSGSRSPRASPPVTTPRSSAAKTPFAPHSQADSTPRSGSAGVIALLAIPVTFLLIRKDEMAKAVAARAPHPTRSPSLPHDALRHNHHPNHKTGVNNAPHTGHLHRQARTRRGERRPRASRLRGARTDTTGWIAVRGLLSPGLAPIHTPVHRRGQHIGRASAGFFQSIRSRSGGSAQQPATFTQPKLTATTAHSTSRDVQRRAADLHGPPPATRRTLALAKYDTGGQKSCASSLTESRQLADEDLGGYDAFTPARPRRPRPPVAGARLSDGRAVGLTGGCQRSRWHGTSPGWNHQVNVAPGRSGRADDRPRSSRRHPSTAAGHARPPPFAGPQTSDRPPTLHPGVADQNRLFLGDAILQEARDGHP